MKKAVILVGGKQYIVTEKETLRVDLLPAGTKELELDALLVTDGDKTTVGTPTVKGVKFQQKLKRPKLRVTSFALFAIKPKNACTKKPAIVRNTLRSKSLKLVKK